MSEQLARGPVVVLTALNLEYEAVRHRLDGLQLHRHKSGTRFETGTVAGTSCSVVLGLTGKGNGASGILTERAIELFDPVAVLFVGVAGALWDDTAIGDVVMATYVYAYHGGTSEDDGRKSRPRVWEADHGVSQIGFHVGRTNEWVADLPGGHPVPKVRFGPIAAGEVVQNSRISADARWIRQHYNDALAIEMEAAGVAQAGHLSGLPVGIVRGISDRADGTKNSADDHDRQPRAAANAAAFAMRLARGIDEERGNTAVPEDNNGGSDRRSVYNTARSSTVGIMAGTVTGATVRVGTEPPKAGPVDMGQELDDLGRRLKHCRLDGALDGETYAEAEHELAAARLAASAGEAAPKKLLLALRKLRGLLDEAPELAAVVTSLISAVSEAR